MLQAWNYVGAIFFCVPLALMSLGPMTAGVRPKTACPYFLGTVSEGVSKNRLKRLSRWLEYPWRGSTLYFFCFLSLTDTGHLSGEVAKGLILV